MVDIIVIICIEMLLVVAVGAFIALRNKYAKKMVLAKTEKSAIVENNTIINNNVTETKNVFSDYKELIGKINAPAQSIIQEETEEDISNMFLNQSIIVSDMMFNEEYSQEELNDNNNDEVSDREYDQMVEEQNRMDMYYNRSILDDSVASEEEKSKPSYSIEEFNEEKEYAAAKERYENLPQAEEDPDSEADSGFAVTMEDFDMLIDSGYDIMEAPEKEPERERIVRSLYLIPDDTFADIIAQKPFYAKMLDNTIKITKKYNV
jgi:hypothetical protein